MADKTFNIIIKLVKQGGADKETISNLVGIKNALTTGAAVAGVVTTAYYAASKALDATVGSYVTLAKEVEKFHNQSGMTAEDSSRLLEVMKDLEISAGDVGTAFKFAQKNGFEPNLQTLTAMQAQYLGLDAGMERTQFLLKEFGKSGLSLQKFFETGDITKRLGEVNDALILTDESFRKMQDYEDTVDALGDAFASVKVAVGGIAIAPLTAYLQLWAAMPGTIEHAATAIVLALGGSFDAFNLELANLAAEGSPFISTLIQMFGLHLPKSIENSRKKVEDLGAGLEELGMKIADQTDWQLLYTGAQTAADQVAASTKLMGGLMEGLGEEGAAVWQGFLQATGEISGPAIRQFVLIQDAYKKARDMIAAGIDLKIVIQTLIIGMIAANAPTVDPQAQRWLQNQQSASGGSRVWVRAGVAGSGANPNAPVWKNTQTGAISLSDPGYVMGGVPGEGAFRVGERGEEWITRNSAGQLVVVPNDIVRRMQAWGITPGRGFGGGGVADPAFTRWKKNQTPPPQGATGNIGGTLENQLNAQDNPFSWMVPYLAGSGGAIGGSYNSGAAAAITQASAVAAVEAVAPVVTETMQIQQAAAQVSSRENTNEVRQQTRAVQQSGEAQATLLRAILSAIEGQPEALAVEIQKRR